MSFKHYWDYEYECRRLAHIRKEHKKRKEEVEKKQKENRRK